MPTQQLWLYQGAAARHYECDEGMLHSFFVVVVVVFQLVVKRTADFQTFETTTCCVHWLVQALHFFVNPGRTLQAFCFISAGEEALETPTDLSLTLNTLRAIILKSSSTRGGITFTTSLKFTFD